MLTLESQARALVEKLKGVGMHESHYAELDALLKQMEQERKDHAGLVEKAIDTHVTDDVEIDEFPLLSVADEGVWVSAWVWVPRDESEGESD